MEIQQLRYFLVAARYQHVTKAAEEIHIAQPALSQIIKRLESEVGTSLFEKNGRNITLTPEGKILQEEALKILKTIDELPIVLQQKKAERDKTIKIKVSAATIWFMPAIIAYKKTHPDVEKCIFRSVENVNLETVIAYKVGGKKHSFLDDYDAESSSPAKKEEKTEQ